MPWNQMTPDTKFRHGDVQYCRADALSANGEPGKIASPSTLVFWSKATNEYLMTDT